MTKRGSLLPGGILLASCFGGASRGQEPINAANSATQPSPGVVLFMEKVKYLRLDLDRGPGNRRGEIEDLEFMTMLHVGVRHDLSLSFDIPAILRDRDFEASGRSEREEGVGDFTFRAKWRFHQQDTSPLNTLRISLIGGARIRSGDAPFSSDSYSPLLGLAFTKIAGRHGFNGSFEWTFTTDGNDEPLYAGESSADLFRYDLAYLFRISPHTYTADTDGALYAVCELNGLYETNGDSELLVAPGVMYEARDWTLELSVQLPVWERVDHRASLDYAVIAGVRFFW